MRNVYNVSIDCAVPHQIHDDRELGHEFGDAQQFEDCGSLDGGAVRHYQVTYGVVAPGKRDAYHRAATLVEAKLAVGGVPEAFVLGGDVFGPEEASDGL